MTRTFGAPQQVLQADHLAAVPALLRAAEAAALAGHRVLGWVAYEAAPAFDPALQVRLPVAGQPLAWFAIYPPDADDDGGPASCAEAAQPVAVVDPIAAGPAVASPDFFCKHWHTADSEVSSATKVASIRRGIAAGDYYQLNLTTRLSSSFQGAPQAFYQALRESQPGAYAAFVDWGGGQVLSVSPELFFRRDGRRITTRPMKGTAPRHTDPAADAAAAALLGQSEKERAENLMIVDLLRNDLARIAETGSVQVESLFEVEPWPSVWQMTSTIAASLRETVDLADIFAALFPCGSVTGAPKVAAMAEIARLESLPRGVYCGAIGVLEPGGDAVFSVGIRTVEVASARATCGIGSAITIDSTAAGEYAEWMAKRRFLLRASAPFELIETLRLESGCLVRVGRHLDRLRRSAAWFGFALDLRALEAALQDCAAAHGAASHRVRLLVSRHGGIRIERFPLEPTPAEVRVQLATTPIAGDRECLVHKTTERSAYQPFATPEPGVFDTLLFNPAGQLTEFTRGNLFADLDGTGVWHTPPVSCGLLPGILREELLADGRARETILSIEDLRRARQLCFGNSLRGLIPARLIEE